MAIRGWPQKLYSDPGCQLTKASSDLHDAIVKSGCENGTADAPWQQGAVESLIKTVKRAIFLAIHNRRRTRVLTVCTEAAHIVAWNVA